MTNEQKNVPELRFPKFEEEWVEIFLEEVVDVYDGTHQTPKYTNEGVKFLSVENIKSLDSNKYISKEAFEKEFKIRPEFGDILMTRIGDIGTPNIIKSNEDFAYYVSLALLKPKNINSYFLKMLILSPFIQNELWKKTLHVAFPKKINKNEIGKVMVNYPKKQEQQKIGNFFSKLDDQIELEERKLELLEQQKKGYMQKIFSQELRFKDENGDDYPEWKEVKIGDILKERNERSSEGEMLSVTLNKGIVKFDELERKDNSSKDKSNYKKVYKNDIAYNSMRMWQGASGKSEYDGIVSPAYTVTTPIDSINSSFIAHYFKTHKMIHKFRVNSQGLTSDTWNLKYKQLKDIKINICTKEEQYKIASLLTTLDELINKQNKKIEILNNNKQGLLQKMFI